jgi:2-methylcitrate dehydratase PrpD
MEIPLTRHLASFCHNLRYENLSPEVVDRTKYFFLDYLGVAVRGSLSDSSEPVRRLSVDLGGEGKATVLGRTEKVTFPYAALANGTSAHSIELDDTHQGGSIHLGVSVFSAALAVAEQIGGKRKRFHYRISCWFRRGGSTGDGPATQRALHPRIPSTATCGTFGSAVAAAKLLGVGESQLVSALGIAGSQAAGSMES